MLDRLKSFPLTIILTILIWMYAESQFTATQEGLQASIGVGATSAFTVDLQDPGASDKTYHKTIPVRITVEGAKAQVDRLYQQAIGVIAPDPDFSNIVYDPKPEDLHPGTDGTLDTVAMLNQTAYFRRSGVRVVAAVPARVRLQVSARQKEELLGLPEMAVEISGPPAVLRAFDVIVDPRALHITVAGSAESLASVKAALANGPTDPRIRAVLDLYAQDRPTESGTLQRRALRYTLPEGVRVTDGPTEVQFKLEKRLVP